MGAGSAALQREVWSREGLGSRERRLVAIACVGFAVTADPIIEQVHAALEGGELTVDELLEVVLHFAVYCGWPKASNLEMYVRQGVGAGPGGARRKTDFSPPPTDRRHRARDQRLGGARRSR